MIEHYQINERVAILPFGRRVSPSRNAAVSVLPVASRAGCEDRLDVEGEVYLGTYLPQVRLPDIHYHLMPLDLHGSERH